MTTEDKDMLRKLRVFLAEGEFTIQGKAIKEFVGVLQWLNSIESKLEELEKLKAQPVKKTRTKK